MEWYTTGWVILTMFNFLIELVFCLVNYKCENKYSPWNLLIYVPYWVWTCFVFVDLGVF